MPPQRLQVILVVIVTLSVTRTQADADDILAIKSAVKEPIDLWLWEKPAPRDSAGEKWLRPPTYITHNQTRHLQPRTSGPYFLVGRDEANHDMVFGWLPTDEVSARDPEAVFVIGGGMVELQEEVTTTVTVCSPEERTATRLRWVWVCELINGVNVCRQVQKEEPYTYTVWVPHQEERTVIQTNLQPVTYLNVLSKGKEYPVDEFLSPEME